MNVYELQSHITDALGPYRTPANSGRSGSGTSESRSQISEGRHSATWAADYGAGRPAIKAAGVDAARLHDDWSGGCDGSSGPQRKSRLDNGDRRFGAALWNEMITALCPGTRNVIIGFGVLVFIVVV